LGTGKFRRRSGHAQHTCRPMKIQRFAPPRRIELRGDKPSPLREVDTCAFPENHRRPTHTLAPFPEELLAAKKQIRERARSYGLDFFPTIFEMCDYEQKNQIGAYGGFPQRYQHWRFGMEYESLRKRHHYGLGRIYEMVINNDPCSACSQEATRVGEQHV